VERYGTDLVLDRDGRPERRCRDRVRRALHAVQNEIVAEIVHLLPNTRLARIPERDHADHRRNSDGDA
jgi:hypothetical protein